MATLNAKQLKARWAHAIPVSSNPAEALLLATASFTVSPFGATNGRLDFRGVSIAGCAETKTSTIESVPAGITLFNLALKRIDFTGASFEDIQFFDCVISDCVFDLCFWRSILFWGKSKIVDCSFLKSKLHAIGFNEADIDRCHFIKTKWISRYNYFKMVRFGDCVFEGPINGLNFGSAILRACKFIGDLHDVTFCGWKTYPHPQRVVTGTEPGQGYWLETPFELIPNKMEGVDFSQATMRMTNLHYYCYLHRVILPSLETHCVIVRSPKLKEALESAVKQKFSSSNLEASRDAMLSQMHWFNYHAYVPHYIIHRDSFRNLSSEDSDALFLLTAEVAEALNLRLTNTASHL